MAKKRVDWDYPREQGHTHIFMRSLKRNSPDTFGPWEKVMLNSQGGLTSDGERKAQNAHQIKTQNNRVIKDRWGCGINVKKVPDVSKELKAFREARRKRHK